MQNIKTNLADLVIRNNKAKFKSDAKLKTFTTQFFDRIFVNNPEKHDTDGLFNLADGLYKFFVRRSKQDVPKIEVERAKGKALGRATVKILTDDMPFLVDSITAELSRQGFDICQLIHPILCSERDNKGNLKKLVKKQGSSNKLESLMCIHISSLPSGKTSKQLEADLEKILCAVDVAVSDWKEMVTCSNDAIKNLQDHAPQNADTHEAVDFLAWLSDNHFTFLGAAYYDIKNGKHVLKKSSSLGVMRPQICQHENEILPQEISELAKSKKVLEIQKSEYKSLVHRDVYMDQVGVKKYNSKGELVGEYWFLGLFASAVYYQTTLQIPIIRRKVRRILDNSGYDRGGHSRKIIQFVLDSYPRDEIFQSTECELLENALGILGLMERPRVGLFVRRDKYDRFFSCLIYVPKDRFDTNLRYKIQTIMESCLNGRVMEYYTQITDSPLSRLHLIIKPEGEARRISSYNEMLERITEAANLWTDDFKIQLVDRFGEEEGAQYITKYVNAFSEGFKATHNTKHAIYDMLKIEETLNKNDISVEFYETKIVGDGKFHIKIFNPGQQLYLSDILPVLENMGLDIIAEQPFMVRPNVTDCQGVWVRDFRVKLANGSTPKLDDLKEIFEEAIQKVLKGEVEDDGFNRLVLFANFKWREVVIIRSISKYLKQAGVTLAQEFIQEAIARHPKLVSCLRDLFYARFKKGSGLNENKISSEIASLLSKVENVNEDIIIRKFAAVIKAILRTNYFLDDERKDYISYKIRSELLPDLPLPRPFVEVFVYSPRVEAVHLRGGMAARGGIRWSDRHEDFRTEILGLMKAQMVKNSVIVPVGSKGGFIVKQPPTEGGRDAVFSEGKECYKTFLRGALDITDNIVGGKIKKPKDVICYDGDDAYLVVAADKGTATFSDVANGISEDYGFWLGDAFASGGSVGYDHKAMGITARGAWVSVQRHFREMGIDTQAEDFTVVGIGDMAGDVFGNGMLLSKHIRLVAAFNHMHIFIDPNPDSGSGFKERKRLFEKPRSAWTDYNAKLISEGGGIFERSAKVIKINKHICEALGIEKGTKQLTPDELIKAILKSPVDLMWNGGIGTYVKARHESNEQAGDKANDSLRINGGELRCKVVGEGGNLGLTQLGRIEFAVNGGRINTDAIDNSAGVDCSDHEVNIKIALAAAVENSKISINARNKLLENMTDEVADLVLRDNYLQTQAITITATQGASLLETQEAFMDALEAEGELNREIEFLPDKEEISRRMVDKRGLTRPEVSVLLAYSKLHLYQKILDSNVPDGEYFGRDLLLYFPKEMRKEYEEEIKNHKLRREIIATFVTNSVVNRVGSVFLYNVCRDTGMEACDVARAYTMARDAFRLREIWMDIEALDGAVSADTQATMFIDVGRFIERMTYWFLRNLKQPLDVQDSVEKFVPDIAMFDKCMPQILTKSLKDSQDKDVLNLTAYGVPRVLATKIARLEALAAACDIAMVARKYDKPINIVGKIYFELGAHISLGWLRFAANQVSADNYWHKLAVRNLIDALYDEQRRLTGQVMALCGSDLCDTSLNTWYESNKKEIDRYKRFIEDIKKADATDIAMLSSVVRRIENLCSV